MAPGDDSFVVMAIASFIPSSGTVPTVAIAQPGVTWNTDNTVASPTGGTPGVVIHTYFTTAISNAIDRLTISYTGEPSIGVMCYGEYVGVESVATPKDVTDTNSGTGAPIPAGPTPVTTQANELHFAAFSSQNATGTASSVTNSFSIVEKQNALGDITASDQDGIPALTIAEFIASATGTPQSNAIVPTGERFASIMTAYKELTSTPVVIPSGDAQVIEDLLVKSTTQVSDGVANLMEQFRS